LSSALRADYSRKSREYSVGMHWPEIGAAYRKIFARIAGPQPQRDDISVRADRLAIAGA